MTLYCPPPPSPRRLARHQPPLAVTVNRVPLILQRRDPGEVTRAFLVGVRFESTEVRVGSKCGLLQVSRRVEDLVLGSPTSTLQFTQLSGFQVKPSFSKLWSLYRTAYSGTRKDIYKLWHTNLYRDSGFREFMIVKTRSPNFPSSCSTPLDDISVMGPCAYKPFTQVLGGPKPKL